MTSAQKKKKRNEGKKEGKRHWEGKGKRAKKNSLRKKFYEKIVQKIRSKETKRKVKAKAKVKILTECTTRATTSWVADTSIIAGFVHKWLLASDLGGSKVEWLFADHMGNDPVPFDANLVLAFIDVCIQGLLEIALQLCIFFCIEREPMKSALIIFGTLKKESYITDHKNKASGFALFLLQMLFFADQVNSIWWPRRCRYKCNIMKESRKAILALRIKYENLPLRCMRDKSECQTKHLRRVKVYLEPNRGQAYVMSPCFSLPTQPECARGQGERYKVQRDLALVAHCTSEHKVLKKHAQSRKDELTKKINNKRPYAHTKKFSGRDKERADLQRDSHLMQTYARPFSGSCFTDVQILSFLTPAELYRIKSVNKSMSTLVNKHFRVPTEWARKASDHIAKYFASECGVAHLLLGSWIQVPNVSKRY